MTQIVSPIADTDRPSVDEPLLRERVASVLGYRLAYITGGEGEPVIFLHGLGHAASLWNGVLPALARHFRVFAVDMLGCGHSDKPRIDYHLWSMAAYLRYFMDAVGIQRAHLVGHSLGGGIALQTRFQYPERVGRLTLISSGGFGRELRLLLRLPTIPGGSVIMTVVTRPFWDRVIKLFGYREPTAPLKIETRQQWLNLEKPDSRWVFMRMLRGVSNITGQTVSALDRLYLIQDPVLVVWGDHDRTIPVAHAKRAAALISNCQLEILPGCGHYPALQCPEVVAGLVERFLLAPTPASPGLAAPPAGLERANHRKMLVEQPGELSSGIA